MNNFSLSNGEHPQIDINNPANIKVWAEALQTDPESLRKAVEEVGPQIGDVCRKLHVQSGMSMREPNPTGTNSSIDETTERARTAAIEDSEEE